MNSKLETRKPKNADILNDDLNDLLGGGATLVSKSSEQSDNSKEIKISSVEPIEQVANVGRPVSQELKKYESFTVTPQIGIKDDIRLLTKVLGKTQREIVSEAFMNYIKPHEVKLKQLKELLGEN